MKADRTARLLLELGGILMNELPIIKAKRFYHTDKRWFWLGLRLRRLQKVTSTHPRTPFTNQRRVARARSSTFRTRSEISPERSSDPRSVPASRPHSRGGVQRRPSISSTR